MNTLFDEEPEPKPDPAALGFEVLAKTDWQIHHGGIGNPSGGVVGQLTKCCYHNGVIFYVRENLATGSMERFLMSSGERIGWKRVSVSKRHSQVLELLAPEQWWSILAEVVRAADRLNREVRRKRTFTS